MFPSLLRDHRVSEDMPKLNEEIQTFYDVFMLLKELKTELWSGSRNFELLEDKPAAQIIRIVSDISSVYNNGSKSCYPP